MGYLICNKCKNYYELQTGESPENMDYNVVGIAENGNDAVKKTEELSPDLVLMDITLKGDIDGIETAQKIRDLYNTPFIYLSGSHDNTVLEKAKTSKPSCYITKPFEDIEIKNAIQTAFIK